MKSSRCGASASSSADSAFAFKEAASARAAVQLLAERRVGVTEKPPERRVETHQAGALVQILKREAESELERFGFGRCRRRKMQCLYGIQDHWVVESRETPPASARR